MIQKYLLPVLAVALSLAGCRDSMLKETTVSLNTYPFSDPNPVANPDKPFYPYFSFDGYSHEGQPKEWKAVELENVYVKVTILPEIGGKIWGAVEKSTGNEFIYFNHAAKFRNIAMRGPWTSGGIEANFGIIGHAPTCSTPVDYATRTNPDGSVSCFVGSLDMLTSTWWCVEVNLQKDKAHFTTHTTWNNASPLDQPYYHWMNAGYKATPDMTFCFPGNAYIGHGGDVHPWPVDEQGRNINRYAAHDFGGDKSMHVVGEVSDYFGAYWDDTDFGTVHHSDFDEKLGMKVFIWGLSRQGMIWEDLLTDTDGQYLEMQSGRMFNQAVASSNRTPYKHIGFRPYAQDAWTEYWYPVKATKGMVKANEYGALNLKREGETVELYFSPVQKMDEPVTVYQGGEKVFEGRLAASPLETWNASFQADAKAALKVVVGNGLLAYDEDPAHRLASRPKVTPEGFDWNSVYGLWLDGKLWMDQKQYTKAKACLEAALAKDANYPPALNDLAALYFRRGEYAQAAELARRAIGINAYDADANFIYGLSNSRLGKSVDALDGFSLAAYSPGLRPAAYIELAREHVKAGNNARAARYAGKALELAPGNQNAQMLAALAARKNGEKTRAGELLGRVEQQFPLNHFVRVERFLGSRSEADKKKIADGIKNELPYQTYLEMAGWYETMGCRKEAAEVLEMAEPNALVCYRLAYLYDQLGDKEKAARTLDKALAASPDRMFPYRPETLAAFLWAKDRNDGHWKTDYYLGLAKWALGDKEAGAEYLRKCGDRPDYAPFYLTRATLAYGEPKLKDLLRAESLEESWRTGLELVNYYNGAEEYGKALEYARKYARLYPDNYIIGLKLAYGLVRNGQYDECVAYMQKLRVLPNEGASEGRIIYRDANLMSALQSMKGKDYDKALSSIEKSKEYIENLGVGKPYDELIDKRATDFITALCYEQTGDKEKAGEYYRMVCDARQPANSNLLVTAFAQRKLGQTQAAAATLSRLQQEGGDPFIARYCLACFRGDKAGAEQCLQQKMAAKEAAPWEKSQADNELSLVKAIADYF